MIQGFVAQISKSLPPKSIAGNELVKQSSFHGSGMGIYPGKPGNWRSTSYQ
jgi:hypothetical protein